MVKIPIIGGGEKGAVTWKCWHLIKSGMKGKCIHCGSTVFIEEECEPVGLLCEDCELLEPDYSPTGHGEECFSDADPGL